MRKMSASRVYMLLSLGTALAESIMFTTYAVYYVSTLKLNPLQLVLVGTALELSVFILEVPTGVVADTYSRRLSVVVSMLLMGAAYIIKGSIPFLPSTLFGISLSAFAVVLFAEMIRGLGWCFTSGALEAWITDEVGPEHVGRLFMKTGQLERVAALVGIPISVGLASLALNLPYVVGGILHLTLGVLLIAVMPETSFKPCREVRGWQALSSTFKEGVRAVRGNPVLIMALGVTVFTGAALEGRDRLWQAHLLQNFSLPGLGQLKPVAWFGIIAAISSLFGIAAAGLIRRWLNLECGRSMVRTLIVCAALNITALAFFGLTGSFVVAIAACLAFPVIQAVQGPVYRAWLNGNIDSRARATVLSMVSQTDALGQSAVGPVVGFVGKRYSIRASMVLSAAMLSPALGVFLRVLRRERNKVNQEGFTPAARG